MSVTLLFLLSDFFNRPAVNQELSNIFNELWRLDVNHMKPGIDYTISVQVWNILFTQLLISVFSHPYYVCELFRVEPVL